MLIFAFSKHRSSRRPRIRKPPRPHSMKVFYSLFRPKTITSQTHHISYPTLHNLLHLHTPIRPTGHRQPRARRRLHLARTGTRSRREPPGPDLGSAGAGRDPHPPHAILAFLLPRRAPPAIPAARDLEAGDRVARSKWEEVLAGVRCLVVDRGSLFMIWRGGVWKLALI